LLGQAKKIQNKGGNPLKLHLAIHSQQKYDHTKPHKGDQVSSKLDDSKKCVLSWMPAKNIKIS